MPTDSFFRYLYVHNVNVDAMFCSVISFVCMYINICAYLLTNDFARVFQSTLILTNFVLKIADDSDDVFLLLDLNKMTSQPFFVHFLEADKGTSCKKRIFFILKLTDNSVEIC